MIVLFILLFLNFECFMHLIHFPALFEEFGSWGNRFELYMSWYFRNEVLFFFHQWSYTTYIYLYEFIKTINAEEPSRSINDSSISVLFLFLFFLFSVFFLSRFQFMTCFVSLGPLIFYDGFFPLIFTYCSSFLHFFCFKFLLIQILQHCRFS